MYQEKITPLFFILLYFSLPASAQNLPYNPVFDDADVPKVTIQIDQVSLDQILAPENEFSDEEFPATFIFSSAVLQDTVKNVGFRLRGNTSRVSQKKSFKVSFNSFEPGRKFRGLEKLNLNGEHNDPSIIRSKLSWDLFQSAGLPASRANHVEVFINEEYRGLYINVEHIDEQFLESRFGNNDGNLYKCLYPADLTYRGPNGDDYTFYSGDRRTYDLKLKDNDEGAYDDLAHFINTLNNASDNGFQHAIESIFDVNGYLQILALEVATGSWDGYWFLMNNYYLYANPETSLFHFIPFDYDNTFGIDFVNGDWGTRNVYNWGHASDARPLTERLLGVNKFRNRFTYYLKQVLEKEFNPDRLFPRIDQLLNMIRPSAEADPFKTLDYGYDNDAFLSSYTEALGGHVPYGLKPFITTRYDHALTQLDTNANVEPIINELSIHTTPQRPAPADPVTFFAAIEDESTSLNVILEYRLDLQPWQSTTLTDDGSNGDAMPSDGIYTGLLPAFGQAGSLSYIISARDEDQQTSFARTRILEIGFPKIDLHINEFMASNNTTVADEAGEFDDWVEFYNNAASPLSLEGKFFTDNLTVPDKWPLPQVAINPGEFLLVWLDGQIEQGPLHAPFKLSASGEEVGLFGRDETSFYPIDTLSFGLQAPDHSFARSIDGAGSFQDSSQPTPGASNQIGVYLEEETNTNTATLGLPYPNPFSHETTLLLDLPVIESIELEVFDLLGRSLISLRKGSLSQGTHKIVWGGRNQEGKALTAGVYFVQLKHVLSGERNIRKVVYIPQ